jgi:methylmalonyl-CoA mutase N-terminal domain/subunit
MFDKKKLEEIANENKSWEQGPVDTYRKMMPERKPEWTTESGIPIKSLYTPLDVADMDYCDEIGSPGQYPYLRGAYPTMYRSRPWSIRQFTSVHGAEETAQRIMVELGEDIDRFNLCADDAILDSFVDPDDPSFEKLYGSKYLGRSAVILVTLKDYEVLYENVPIDRVSFSTAWANYTTREVGMYLALAKRRGVPWEKLRGYSQGDCLQMYAGNYAPSFPPEDALTIQADLVKFLSKNVPKWYHTSMCAYNRAEAGYNPVQELAYTMADAVAIIKACLDKGLKIDEFAPKMSFHINFKRDFFEHIAKLRASRRMWAKLIKERFGAKNPESWRLRFFVETNGSELTAQQPYNNIIRSTTQALGAVLGGCNALDVCAFDEALATPTEFSHTLARRTQQILLEETGVGDVIDPLAGSYYVEWLTSQVEKKAWELLDAVEAMGGAVKAIENGYYLEEINKAVTEDHRKLKNGQKIVVGVNKYTLEKEPVKPPLIKFNKEAYDRSINRLKKVKLERDNEKVQQALNELSAACKKREGITEATVKACEAYCTHAEMARAVKEVYGLYQHSKAAVLA